MAAVIFAGTCASFVCIGRPGVANIHRLAAFNPNHTCFLLSLIACKKGPHASMTSLVSMPSPSAWLAVWFLEDSG
jgi:hypothetical protein